MFVVSCAKKLGGRVIYHHVVRRTLSTSKNYYESLGITPNATQQEVKAAYFKLSKLHHPDMNPTDVDSSKKFREISQAYEILGNVNLRKKYDQSLSSGKEEFDPWNDPDPFSTQTQRKPPPTGRDSYYNYDEWTKRHYEHLFWRQEEEKRRRMMQERIRQNLRKSGYTEHYLFTRWLTLVVIIMFTVLVLDIRFHEGSEPEQRRRSDRK